MLFADIIGHEATKEDLRAMVDTDRVPHAILLSGPSGIGKMSLARAFTQYLQCTDRHDGDSCGKCNSCLLHKGLNHPDLHFTYPIHKSETKKIRVSLDNINEWKRFIQETPYLPYERWIELLDAPNAQPQIHVQESQDIINWLSLSSYTSRYKVNIIWLPERLNAQAANKLLKIVEEPYPDSVFILVSDNPAGVLPTIVSRTRPLTMLRLGEDEVMRGLTAQGVSAEDAANAARLSGGNMNTALAMTVDSGEINLFMKSFQDMMRNAYSRQVGLLKSLAEKIAEWGREKQVRYLNYCARMIRENFIYNLRQPALNLMTDAEEAFSTRFSPFINAANVEELTAEVDRAVRDIRRNGNSKLVFLDLMLYIMLLIRKQS